MPFVKMMADDAKRSHGRVRVRILDESTNRLVTYPSGRVRWFGSEAAADDWIESQTPPKTRPTYRPRNYSETT